MRRQVTLNPIFLIKASPPVRKLAAVVHTATLELIDAEQLVAAFPVDTCQVITTVTVAPASVVEGETDVLIFITVEITTRQVCGFTAAAFLDIVKPIILGVVQSLNKVTIWTNCPMEIPEKYSIC